MWCQYFFTYWHISSVLSFVLCCEIYSLVRNSQKSNMFNQRVLKLSTVSNDCVMLWHSALHVQFSALTHTRALLSGSTWCVLTALSTTLNSLHAITSYNDKTGWSSRQCLLHAQPVGNNVSLVWWNSDDDWWDIRRTVNYVFLNITKHHFYRLPLSCWKSRAVAR